MHKLNACSWALSAPLLCLSGNRNIGYSHIFLQQKLQRWNNIGLATVNFPLPFLICVSFKLDGLLKWFSQQSKVMPLHFSLPTEESWNSLFCKKKKNLKSFLVRWENENFYCHHIMGQKERIKGRVFCWQFWVGNVGLVTELLLLSRKSNLPEQ